MEDNSVTLELATEEQILMELRNRFKDFIYARTNPTKSGKEEIFYFYWAGSLTTALGLSQRVIVRLSDRVNKLPSEDEES